MGLFPNPDDQRQAQLDDAKARIHQLLAELHEIIGPLASPDYEPGDAPVGTTALWEYAVACCWVDDTGETFYSVVPSDGLLPHHTAGLLAAARDHYGYQAVAR